MTGKAYTRAVRAERQRGGRLRRPAPRTASLAGLQRTAGNRAVAGLLHSVRVHTGPEAAMQAERAGAHAFTRGRDIFLGADVDPHDPQVLRHELAHVVQQARGAAGEQPAGPAELESEAHAAAADPAAPVAGAAPSGAVQRLDKDQPLQQEEEEEGELLKWLTPLATGLSSKWLPPGLGDIGQIARYSPKVKPANWLLGMRLSEDEHVLMRAIVEALTRDPKTGESPYVSGGAAYKKATTVRLPRSVALAKTNLGAMSDAARFAAIQQTLAKGGAVNWTEDVLLPALQATKKAAAGTLESKINIAALAQQSEIFQFNQPNVKAPKLSWQAAPVMKMLKEQASLFKAARSAGSTTGEAFQTIAPGLKTMAKMAGGKLLEGGGAALGVLGSLAGGIQTGTGLNELFFEKDKKALGGIDVGEGLANLGLTIGVPLLAKKGVAAGAGGGGLALAGLAAGGSVALLGETARTAVKGEETPIDVAGKYYRKQFGDWVPDISDLYGWSQRTKLVPEPFKQLIAGQEDLAEKVYYNLFLK